jgi:hypothetical protein
MSEEIGRAIGGQLPVDHPDRKGEQQQADDMRQPPETLEPRCFDDLDLWRIRTGRWGRTVRRRCRTEHDAAPATS